MTGPEHYKEAERLRDCARDALGDNDKYNSAAYFNAAAQVHATLALAAATAEPIAQAYDGPDDTSIPRAWSAAIS